MRLPWRGNVFDNDVDTLRGVGRPAAQFLEGKRLAVYAQDLPPLLQCCRVHTALQTYCFEFRGHFEHDGAGHSLGRCVAGGVGRFLRCAIASAVPPVPDNDA